MLTQLTSLLGLTHNLQTRPGQGDTEAEIDFAQVFANLEGEMDNTESELPVPIEQDKNSETSDKKEEIVESPTDTDISEAPEPQSDIAIQENKEELDFGSGPRIDTGLRPDSGEGVALTTSSSNESRRPDSNFEYTGTEFVEQKKEPDPTPLTSKGNPLREIEAIDRGEIPVPRVLTNSGITKADVIPQADKSVDLPSRPERKITLSDQEPQDKKINMPEASTLPIFSRNTQKHIHVETPLPTESASAFDRTPRGAAQEIIPTTHPKPVTGEHVRERDAAPIPTILPETRRYPIQGAKKGEVNPPSIQTTNPIPNRTTAVSVSVPDDLHSPPTAVDLRQPDSLLRKNELNALISKPFQGSQADSSLQQTVASQPFVAEKPATAPVTVDHISPHAPVPNVEDPATVQKPILQNVRTPEFTIPKEGAVQIEQMGQVATPAANKVYESGIVESETVLPASFTFATPRPQPQTPQELSPNKGNLEPAPQKIEPSSLQSGPISEAKPQVRPPVDSPKVDPERDVPSDLKISIRRLPSQDLSQGPMAQQSRVESVSGNGTNPIAQSVPATMQVRSEDNKPERLAQSTSVEPEFSRSAKTDAAPADNAYKVPQDHTTNRPVKAPPTLEGQSIDFSMRGMSSMQTLGVTSPFLVGFDEEVDGLELAINSSGIDARQSASTSLSSAPTHQSRPDPTQLVRQISDGIQKMSDGGVELRLNPEELGSVRMQFTQSEQGLSVHISTDRPETLELIRRHIDQLAKDLEASGFDATGFTFGDEAPQREQNQFGTSDKDAEIEDQIPTSHPSSVVQDGLDIRV